MKSIIKAFFLFVVVMFYTTVSAKEVQVFFVTEGGSTKTSGFKIVDDYVQKSDGTYCATYQSNGIINKLNTINGSSFSISKSGTSLVSGREWYTYNYENNKLYYFNQNNSYNVSTILQKLSMSNDSYPVISLFAHWKGDGVDGGIDMGGTPNNSSSNTAKVKSISISGSNKITKGKTSTLKVTYSPSNAKKESISWSSSNKKIATIDKNGKVTGVSNGNVTITAKTSSGKKATIKVSVVEVTNHYVKLKFDMNGGSLSTTTSKRVSSSGNLVLIDKSTICQKFAYGSSTQSAGLINYNNKDLVNIKRNGYIAKSGAEWNTKKDGTGKSFNHDKVYKASDFCDASKKDCEITLYVNWIKYTAPHYVKLKFDMNGGSLSTTTSKRVSSSGNLVLIDKSSICQQFAYGSSTQSAGLINYNNKDLVNIKRNGYIAKSGAEWNTKKDGTGKSFNHDKVYKASDFCDASKKDCEITLYVNWVKDGIKSASYVNRANIKFHVNGGNLNTNAKNIKVKDQILYCDNQSVCQVVGVNQNTSNNGLMDCNNKDYINLTKSGYYIVKDYEWNTKPDGTGKSYSQSKVYNSKDFCDASKGDCTITLYANWKIAPMNSGFEITYWLGPSSARIISNPSQVQYIKDAGFTLVPLSANHSNLSTYDSQMEQAIKMFNDKGIKVIVDSKNDYNSHIKKGSSWSDSQWESDLKNTIDFYSKFKNVVGYFIVDEPSKTSFSRIGKVNSIINKYDPKRYAYINLLPGDSYANTNQNQFGTTSYNDYINSFVNTVNPKIISFDRYPAIFANTLTPYNNRNFKLADYNNIKKRYYNTFNMIYSASRKNNSIPMSILLLTQYHNNKLFYRNLSHNEIAYQVSLSLAFGMKRFSYFTYSNWGDGNALMDANYNPTKHYYDVKIINEWAKKIGDQLYSLPRTAVYGFNEVSELNSYNKEIGKISTNNVGILSKFGNNTFLLTNSDMVNKNPNAVFEFDKLSSLQWFNTSNGKWENITTKKMANVSFNTSKKTITLEFGHCVLLRKK